MTADQPAKSTGNLLAWLQLMRISALPTAVSNILAGFLLANQSWTPTSKLLLLIASSSCLYISGMILNDYCDRQVDADARSGRPIPSGRIRASHALIIWAILSIIGVLLAWATSLTSFIIAILIVIAIVAYNRVLKTTFVAPIAMATCRFLNILLGASFVAAANGLPSATTIMGIPKIAYWVAACIGVFICGITWFARNEATNSKRGYLLSSAALIVAGIAGLATTGFFLDLANPMRLALLVALISLPALFRVAVATRAPTPMHVQQAVRALIQSLILFDAAVCILANPSQPIFAIATLALLFPAMFLSRFISST